MATTTTEQNKELARRDIDEIWNEGNLDLVDELYSEDFVHHDPAYPGSVRGPDGQKAFVETYTTAFPGDPNISIDELLSEDEFVVIRWTGRGTHEGAFMGIDPTHEPIEVTGMTMARVENGTIAEMWSQYDALGLLRQIGAVDSPSP